MNSVHELGSNGDSETLPSQKTRSKTEPGARAPKLAQLAQPVRTGRVRVAVSWAAWPYRSRAPRPCRSAPRALAPARLPLLPLLPRAPCRAPCAFTRMQRTCLCRAPAPCTRLPSALHAQRLPSAHAPCHDTILYCDTILPPAALPATIQSVCIAIQLAIQASQPAIQYLYCNTVRPEKFQFLE